MAELGISHRLACSYTSHQNRYVERKHIHVMEVGLIHIFHSIFGIIVFLQQSMLSIESLLHGSLNSTLFLMPCTISYPLLSQSKSLVVFAFHILDPITNINYTSWVKSVCIGVSSQHRGYKCLNNLGKIIISKRCNVSWGYKCLNKIE